MRFLVLGPVSATVDGEPVDLGRRRERHLLALLLLETGRPVPAPRLVDLLWDDTPPGDPRAALHIHVSRLRRRLTEVGADRFDVELRTDPAGYLLDPGWATVDLHEFRDLVERARHTPSVADRAGLLREALELWRGPALADIVPEESRHRAAAALDEARLSALESRVAADLELGRQHELVPELTALVADDPGRESLVGPLMVALHRCGRQQDALAAYHRTASYLSQQLGMDPGRELRELHLAVLRDDPALAAGAGPGLPAPAAATAVTAPAQLPADLQSFVGRTGELDRLSALRRARLDGAAPLVVAITGMAGIGKTAFAVHIGHRLRDGYPDGQIFLDLHGFADGLAPMAPALALDRILRAFGVGADQIPETVDERAALYRSTLADRRVLLILDNVESESQVAPLLPGAPGCLTLVTSRLALTGLDEVVPVPLGVLSRAEAVDLLGTGGDAVTASAVVDLCGRLPLAVRLAGARLRHRPSWTMSHLAGLLRDEGGRLAELAAGDRSVAAAIRLSYHQLRPDQRLLFRRLGHVAAPSVSPTAAAAAVADVDRGVAGRLLEQLVDVCLLEHRDHDRYATHDLVRLFARETAAVEDTADEAERASRRLGEAYLHSVHNATDTMADGRTPRFFDLDFASPYAETFADVAAATAWVQAECQNVVAVIEDASARGLPDLVWRLALHLSRYLSRARRLDDWTAVHRLGVRAAEALDDPKARALMEVDQAYWFMAQSGFREALRHYEIAAELAAPLGDNLLGAYLDAYRGRSLQSLGELAEAAERFRSALATPAFQAETQEVSWTRLELAGLYARQGRHDDAVTEFHRVLGEADAFGDRGLACFAHHNLGFGYQLRNLTAQAERHTRLAIDVAQQIGYTLREGRGWEQLGDILRASGQPVAAHGAWRRAVEVYDRVDRRLADQLRRRVGTATAAATSADRPRLAS
jgi:DNA-binding SARP family transcriptional activator/tetratricopeptide (TPR) repeat protein